METNFEADMKRIESEWRKKADSYFVALREVAREKGGDEYAFQVFHSSETDGPIPNPGPIILMDRDFPGSMRDVQERIDLLQEVKRKNSMLYKVQRTGLYVANAINKSFMFGLYPPR